MKKTLLLLSVLISGTISFAQERAGSPKGGINKEMMTEIEKGYTGNRNDRAVRNALNTTPIMKLAENADNMAMIDTHFSDEVKTEGRTNQHRSGRCWLFTGLNVLRAKMIDDYNLGDFQFSQSYLFFFDQLEKANLFLQGVIDTRALPFEDRKVDHLFKNPLSDGGQFTGVSNLITKYGIVPSEVMPESYCANNTSQMAMIIKQRIREGGLKLREIYRESGIEKMDKRQAVKTDEIVTATMHKEKVEILKDVYRILALCMGVPPTEFTWTAYDRDGKEIDTKKYTPKSFYDEYIGLDLENNYVMIMNDPVREYYKVYEIDYDRHVYDGHNWVYINLPMDEIKKMSIASIKANTAMYFSCDVGKFLNGEKGVNDLKNFDYESLFGIEFGMDKKQRVRTYDSGSSHAMTLIAVDIKDDKPVKWMVENSWGKDSGWNGNIIMTDEWFDEYMFRVVVEKRFVPGNILKLLDEKPIMLPAWDPMFAPEN